MHRPVLPVDQAASHPASSILPLRPGCVSRLPLPRSLSAEPASESSGCPLASSLRLCRRWPFELPRTSHAFGVAGFSEFPELPRCSRLLLPRLRWRTRVAPRPASPALPAMDHRVAPMLASFGGADLPVLRLPQGRPFGIADDSLSELPRTLNPPAPIDGYPSYLGSHTIRFALVRFPSRPGSPPLATAIDQFPGCPKSWVSHRSPIPRVSSCPESWFLG